MKIYKGINYPVRKDPRGYFYSSDGISQLRSGILILLLTNFGERVMQPDYGTNLRNLMFDPNDPRLQIEAQTLITNAINKWEPRISVRDIQVSSGGDFNTLNNLDDQSEIENILSIKIDFVDPQSIKQVESITLKIPLGGTA